MNSFYQGKKLSELNTSHHNNIIKQQHMAEYLGCYLDANIESIVMKPLRKISTKLQFLHSQNEYLTPELLRLLCNSLIQSHFDYACVTWYR